MGMAFVGLGLSTTASSIPLGIVQDLTGAGRLDAISGFLSSSGMPIFTIWVGSTFRCDPPREASPEGSLYN